ncbi:MAG: TIGR03032 family protein [Flavobacteriales bacterium]
MAQQQPATAPFSCTYSPNVPELLLRLNCSLVISTYQAGKLIFLSPKNEDSLIQLPRTFNKPMGIALSEEGNKMAVACKEEIVVFKNPPQLAVHYPKSPNTYDSLYFPRNTFHTGALDIHDLNWCSNTLYAVNTLFSCVVSINDDYNFTPYWTPSFITELVSEDRCHLNGMATENHLPKYVSAFGKGNTFQSWREKITTSGLIIDVTTNEIITENLAMPHSPRLFNNELYVLLSATGELIKINRANGSKETVVKLSGFVRGMDFHKDFLFIGLSKLRKNSSTFAHLKIAEKSNYAGIAIIHLPTASLCGEIRYHTSVDEIYDVQVLPDKIRPNILNTTDTFHTLGVSAPGHTYWARTNEKEN